MFKICKVAGWLIVCALPVAAGCARSADSVQNPSPNPSAYPGTGAAPVPAYPVHAEPVLPQARDKVAKWARVMIWNKQYNELEKAAAAWRASKEEYPDGYWKLAILYDALGQIPRTPDGDAQWLSNLREWVAQMPESITARVAQAEALTSYGWEARGGGSGQSVSKENQQLFQDRLAQARQTLRDAKTLKAKCPHWWAVAQEVALGQGWPADAYEGLFKEAVAFEPTYFVFYANKQHRILPRWYGQVGDAMAFTTAAANEQKDAAQGDLLYSRLIYKLFRSDSDSFPDPTISFARLDKGFVLMDKKYPDDIELKAIWARFCMLTGAPADEADRKARARDLYAAMEVISPDVNTKWRADIEDVRRWAFEK